MVSRWARRALGCLLLAAFASAAAKEAAPASNDPALEARMLIVAAELRCLVCQNQTIADSNSGLADDLRQQIREQLGRGASNEQVVEYMTERYGDFVRYRPPFNPATALLWLGPGLLLVAGLGTLALVLRRRARLAPDAFEADELDPDEVNPDEFELRSALGPRPQDTRP